MRDLLLLIVVFGSLPITLIQPFVGLLVYSWLAYMRPHDLVWGVLPQVSLFVAIATLAGMILAFGRERWITLRPQTLLLIGFGCWFGFSSAMAIDPGLALPWEIQVAKILLISLLTTGLVRTEGRFRMLYLVVAFSLGFLGFKYGVFGLLRGGARISTGPGGFMTDSNAFAVALNMALPLLVGVALVERHKLIRAGAVILGFGSIAAIIFTFSRGGLLTLMVVGAYILARSGKPILMTLLLIVAIAGFLVTVSADFEQAYGDRATTIGSYQEEQSAVTRLHEWKVALMISRDYPVFGVGPDNILLVRPFYPADPNDPVGSAGRVTHNSFLQMLVATGYPGLLLFSAAMAVSLLRLGRLRRTSSKPWATTYASMMQGSFLAYLVGGMFLDMGFLDLTYHLVAMTVSLELAAEGSTAVDQAAEEIQVLGHDQHWWRQSAHTGGRVS